MSRYGYLISRSISESSLDFEMTRVDCSVYGRVDLPATEYLTLRLQETVQPMQTIRHFSIRTVAFKSNFSQGLYH